MSPTEKKGDRWLSLCSIDCSPSRSLDPSLLIGVLLILTTESEKAWLHGEVIGSGSLMVSTSPRQGAGASYFSLSICSVVDLSARDSSSD